jgi:hypothetical protein
MALFGLIFLLLALAALGLAVGTLRGRPLPPGSCREAYLAGGMLPSCEGCPGLDARSTQPTGSPGGLDDGHRP